MVLLAAGRRGAAAAGPPCGGSLPPWPPLRAPLAPCSPPPGVCAGANKVGRMGSPRRWRGSAAACPRPRRGRSRAAPGRLRRPLPPPCRASAPQGARPAIPPSAALGPFLGGGAPAAPPPARGGSGLFRAGPVRCLVLLPLALPPAALAPSPSRPPPPPGAGERKRLTPAAAGTGGAPLPQRTKKPPRLWLPPPAKRHKRRILFNFSSSRKTSFPDRSIENFQAGTCPQRRRHTPECAAHLRTGHKNRRFRQS